MNDIEKMLDIIKASIELLTTMISLAAAVIGYKTIKAQKKCQEEAEEEVILLPIFPLHYNRKDEECEKY